MLQELMKKWHLASSALQLHSLIMPMDDSAVSNCITLSNTAILNPTA
jgi:hypothetical protein